MAEIPDDLFSEITNIVVEHGPYTPEEVGVLLEDAVVTEP